MHETPIDIILIIAILVSGGIMFWLLDYAEKKSQISVETLISPNPKLVIRNFSDSEKTFPTQNKEEQKSLINKLIGRIRALDEDTSHKLKKNRRSSEIEYHGQVKFPKRVYEGDSKNILIELQSSYEPVESKKKVVKSQESKEGLSLSLQVPWWNDSEEYLELELIAAGIKIEGDKNQRQSLNAKTLHYQWNCYFQNSGDHVFLIAIRVINLQGTTEIGLIENSIKVVKLDHLTQRQVWAWTTVAGCVSGILTVVEILHQLNVW